MRFRHHHALQLGVLGLLLLTQAACGLNRLSNLGMPAAERGEPRSLPGDPLVALDYRRPTPRPPAPVAEVPPSPLLVAVQRADSYYERGLQAMRSGNTGQADSEFEAALDSLLDGGLTRPRSPRALVLGAFPVPTAEWLSRLSAPERNVASVPLRSPDPDEPTQDAPALLGPEDLKAFGQSSGVAPVPEPDIRKYAFPIVFNAQVKAFIEYFETRKWGVISRAFERASRYVPLMRPAFQGQGLPEELLNLAFIESAVNPWATSRAKAAGIWQFMASTARLHGLKVSWWVDERRDPEKSARAAAAYLKSLYRMFDSWPLALAAYNAGEGAVQRAIDRQHTRDFWKLRLPRETQLFVPAFMAMTIISKEPERYGFAPLDEQPLPVDTVTLDQPTSFQTLSRAARISPERLRELNPELIRWSTPPATTPYALRIPAGVKADFLDEMAQIPPTERVGWTAHRVKKGETAGLVAKRYGVSLQTLLDMNSLTKRQGVAPGSTIWVPALGRPVPVAPETAAQPAAPRVASHRVKKGDTLAAVARRHKVQPEDLIRWNGLKTAALRPGQVIRVSAPVDSSAVSPDPSPAPGKVTAKPAFRRYRVKRGDSLWTIAQAHRVSPDDLCQWNRLKRNASLRPGQSLRIGSASS
jgi:membrane-bound lytic murein transglycosylase D